MLHVLDHLHANDDWKQHGIVVGEPVAYLSLENPQEESERVVTDQFDLDAGQTQELLDLIERDETVLQHLAGRSA